MHIVDEVESLALEPGVARPAAAASGISLQQQHAGTVTLFFGMLFILFVTEFLFALACNITLFDLLINLCHVCLNLHEQ
jgi:hypothetical protein